MTFRRSPAAAMALAAAIVTAAWPTGAAGGQPASGAQTSSSNTSRPARLAPQGFSVVLVVGDLQSAGGEEDVPPAARRALADMKEFLPYRSYKLVDAAWIIGTSHVVSRMRGPDDREYEIEITVADPRLARLANGGVTTTPAASDSRLGLAFSLREVNGAREGAAGAASSGGLADDEALASLHAQIEESRARLKDVRARDGGSPPDAARLEKEMALLQARLQDTQRSAERRRASSSSRPAGRAVINTSFSMELGETVVVGTSRLSGNSKALIALLTAVPPKPPRR